MTQWTRFLLVVGLVGCGSPGDGNPDDTNDEADADTDADADADTDTDTDADADAAPEWKGNWRFEVAWGWDCDTTGFGNIKTETGEDTWTLNLSGPADTLEALVDNNDWYYMSGYGDDEALSLCGAFPMYDVSGDPAPSGPDNKLCIDVDTITDAETTSGVMTGKFKGGFGETCELHDSPFTLTK